jgi:predicted XRE-type DNA-binding protein
MSGVQQMSKENLIIEQGSGNVFADLGFPPEEAQNLILRAELINQIEDYVVSSGMTQQQSAKKLGVTQPRLNLLLKGKINEFSIDALVNMAAKAGMQVEMKVKRAA